MNRTRDLPVFPVSPEPIRSGVSPDVAPVRHEFDAKGNGTGPRIALVTLGCDKNTVDSERMMAALVGHGARVSSQVDGADVVIVNTCGFIQSAKEESIETILDAKDLPKPTYVHEVAEVVKALEQDDVGQFPLAALVMPATVDHIQTISELAERMPAKSTYFYPKLLSGLVIRPLE